MATPLDAFTIEQFARLGEVQGRYAGAVADFKRYSLERSNRQSDQNVERQARTADALMLFSKEGQMREEAAARNAKNQMQLVGGRAGLTLKEMEGLSNVELARAIRLSEEAELARKSLTALQDQADTLNIPRGDNTTAGELRGVIADTLEAQREQRIRSDVKTRALAESEAAYEIFQKDLPKIEAAMANNEARAAAEEAALRKELGSITVDPARVLASWQSNPEVQAIISSLKNKDQAALIRGGNRDAINKLPEDIAQSLNSHWLAAQNIEAADAQEQRQNRLRERLVEIKSKKDYVTAGLYQKYGAANIASITLPDAPRSMPGRSSGGNERLPLPDRPSAAATPATAAPQAVGRTPQPDDFPGVSNMMAPGAQAAYAPIGAFANQFANDLGQTLNAGITGLQNTGNFFVGGPRRPNVSVPLPGNPLMAAGRAIQSFFPSQSELDTLAWSYKNPVTTNALPVPGRTMNVAPNYFNSPSFQQSAQDAGPVIDPSYFYTRPLIQR